MFIHTLLELNREVTKAATTIMATEILTAVETAVILNVVGRSIRARDVISSFMS
jgi:hypothetical protein